MIPSLLVALLVVLVGAALRPTPPCRTTPIQSASASPPIRSRHHRELSASALLGRFRPRAVAAPGEVARWCDDLCQATRSGASLTSAIADTTPPAALQGEVDQLTFSLARGVALSDALIGVTDPNPHLEVALTVLRACAENGGPPSEPIDRAASVLRARSADLAEMDTQSAQARLSAKVMTILPVAMLLMMLLTSGSVRGVTATPIGVTTIVIGVGLNLVGWRWMSQIVGRR